MAVALVTIIGEDGTDLFSKNAASEEEIASAEAGMAVAAAESVGKSGSGSSAAKVRSRKAARAR